MNSVPKSCKGFCVYRILILWDAENELLNCRVAQDTSGCVRMMIYLTNTYFLTTEDNFNRVIEIHILSSASLPLFPVISNHQQEISPSHRNNIQGGIWTRDVIPKLWVIRGLALVVECLSTLAWSRGFKSRLGWDFWAGRYRMNPTLLSYRSDVEKYNWSNIAFHAERGSRCPRCIRHGGALSHCNTCT